MAQTRTPQTGRNELEELRYHSKTGRWPDLEYYDKKSGRKSWLVFIEQARAYLGSRTGLPPQQSLDISRDSDPLNYVDPMGR